MNAPAPAEHFVHPFLRPPHEAREALERRLREDRAAARRRAVRLGDTLRAMGLINERQSRRITAAQKKTGRPFGELAVRFGFIKPGDVQAALGLQFGFLRDGEGPLHIPEELTILRRPQSTEAEKIRLMRTRLLTSCEPALLKTVAVIAAGPEAQAAATSVAANLAAAFAQLHRKVLLLDANLRTPELSGFFDTGNAPCFTEAIRKHARFDDVVTPSIVNRLDILATSKPSVHPQVLLADQGFDQILARAKRSYDSTFLLSSAFGSIADGHFVWQKSSGAIIVAKKNHTREATLKKLSTILFDLDTTIIGSILSR